MFRASLASPLLILFVALPANAQTTLPLVEEVEWEPFREQCRPLLKVIDQSGSLLSSGMLRAAQTLLDKKDKNSATAVQKLLDPHCLLAVSINPESRVKAARGPAIVELCRNRETLVLIKILNDGGVTHPLRLRGPELVRAGERGADRWLRADLVAEAPFRPELTGRRLEYRLLRLQPLQSGKREATFQFDVGQGTQDLGFRAEVPILFTVREPKQQE